MTPMITVAMPVKNGAQFLAEAIESILAQTFENFELLILDDHSDDDTARIVQGYMTQDARVRLIKAVSHGLVAGLNQLLELAHGTYFARMDADDIAEPSRFEKQVAHLEQHPECDILGCWVNVIEAKQEVWHYRRSFADTATVLLCGKTPLCHPSIMARTKIMRQLGYRSRYLHMEDMDLFARALLAGLKFYALPEVLLHYRVHSTSVSSQNDALQMSQRAYIVKELLHGFEVDSDIGTIGEFISSACYGQPLKAQYLDVFRQHLLSIYQALENIGVGKTDEWLKKQRWLAEASNGE